MRLVMDSLIALMLVAILGGVVWAHKAREHETFEHQRIYSALAKLHEQTVYHGALGDVELSRTGFPKRIAPTWFGEDLPFNTLVDNNRPWIDVAPPGDMADHPPDPVLNQPGQAGLWYNPNRGIFRARVPELLTESETLTLYNEINNAYLHYLPRVVEEARQPIAHKPLPVTSARAEAPADNHDRVGHRPFKVDGLEQVIESIETQPEPKRRSLRD